MEGLVECFYPNKPQTYLGDVDDTVVQFVQEAVKADESSVAELAELVAALFTIKPDMAGLEHRLQMYKLDLLGEKELQYHAEDMALRVLDGHDLSEDNEQAFAMMSSGLSSTPQVQEPCLEFVSNEDGLELEDQTESLALLREICGLKDNKEDDTLVYIMSKVVFGDVEDTARWILDNGFPRARELKAADEKRRNEEKEREVEAERQARERVVRRFDERPESSEDKLVRERNMKPTVTSESKIRYRDGKVVATNGAKYIEVDVKEPWDGGSKGRIKTKGKRGPGWVAA